MKLFIEAGRLNSKVDSTLLYDRLISFHIIDFFLHLYQINIIWRLLAKNPRTKTTTKKLKLLLAL